MARQITITQNRFDGGMTQDAYDTTPYVTRICQQFDTFTFPHQLVPFRDSEDGDSGATTSKKQAFCVALRTGTTYSLYALGVRTGDTAAEIMYKSLTFNAGTDLGDATWTQTANYQGTPATVTSFKLFCYYAKTALIYGAKDGTHIWAYDPTGSAALANTHQALTYTDISQGLVHSDDDILYIGTFNSAGAAGAKSYIAKNNNGSWNLTALTLPDNLIPISLCEYGKNLAIGCKPVNGVGNSRVLLWDKTSVSWFENLDWGEGTLEILEQINGVLVGVSAVPTISSSGRNKAVFRSYSGATAEPFREIIADASSATLSITGNKQKVNQAVYFLLNITIDGVLYRGVWKIGKSNIGTLGVNFDRANNNDVATSETNGFFIYKDYTFIAYNVSTTAAISKTNDAASWTATSAIDTVVNPNMPAAWFSIKKKLDSFTVFFQPLSTGQQVVARYRVDNQTTYTPIFTKTPTSPDTVLTLYESKMDATKHFDEGYQLQFRLESTGGAIITGYQYQVSEIIT